MNKLLKNISKGMKKKDLYGTNKDSYFGGGEEKKEESSWFKRLRAKLKNPNVEKVEKQGYERAGIGFKKKKKDKKANEQ